MESEQVNWRNFNRHMFSGDGGLDVSQVLHIQRNGKPQPFVARYVLNKSATSLAPAPEIDWFVPMVQMKARGSYERVEEGRCFRRDRTRLGSLSIRDRRVNAYNILAPVNNISFYIPAAELGFLTDRLGLPQIDAFPTLLDRDHYDPVMFHIANVLLHALEHPSEASPLFLDHMFDAMCVHVATTYGGGVSPPKLPHPAALSPQQAHRIKDLLLADLRGHSRLEDLAESCGMSRGHFSRAFKQATGMPPHRWLLWQRVERAKTLLRINDVTLSQIALDCGFADQSHLTRVFSKVVGTSPAAWRRDQRE